MYDRNIEGRHLTFRFDPRLYKDNLLLEDVETESLWSQLSQSAEEGPLQGSRLQTVGSVQTTWKHWKQLHPETLVLSPVLGIRDENYQYQNRWGGNPRYVETMLAFELVLGVERNGVTKAYPFSTLKKLESPISDELNGEPVLIHYNAEANSAYLADPSGQILPSITVYWKSWHSFHPRTAIFSPS